MLPKHLMSEEDIKHKFITPALHAKGWKDRITMETAVKTIIEIERSWKNTSHS